MKRELFLACCTTFAHVSGPPNRLKTKEGRGSSLRCLRSRSAIALAGKTERPAGLMADWESS